MAKKPQLIRRSRVCMNPIVMRTTDSNQVIQRVLATLRLHQRVVWVNAPVAGNTWNERTCHATTVARKHLSVDVFRYCFHFLLGGLCLLQWFAALQFCLALQWCSLHLKVTTFCSSSCLLRFQSQLYPARVHSYELTFIFQRASVSCFRHL